MKIVGRPLTNNMANSMTNKNLGLYLHFPFCAEKCRYCDFLSFGGWDKKDMEAYCKTLIREIEYVGKMDGNGHMVDTIFLGGGTPSLIDEKMMAMVVQAIMDNFIMVGDLEFSIEANPKTLTEKKLRAYREMGINRISMGVQSLDDDLLQFMGRIHTKEDFLANYHLARDCGFQNINLDLMFAIPGQTLKSWLDTVKEILDMGPEHISFYSLQLEERTPFYELFQDGKLELIADEVDREMYHQGLIELKKAGYHHYEISNSAMPGFESRHNLKYWSMEEYLGLGLGAHSYINGMRRSNETSLAAYIEGAKAFDEGNEHRGKKNSLVIEIHKNTKADEISEYIFMGLRKTEGIDLGAFQRRFQSPIEEVYRDNWTAIEKYIIEGYLTYGGDKLCLTKRGIDISNIILAEFI